MTARKIRMPSPEGRFIVFKDWEVVAIKSGVKTQIRRVVKSPRKYHGGLMNCAWACPVAQPGDTIHVREAWQGPLIDGDEAQVGTQAELNRVENCVYRADGGPAPEFMDADDNLRSGWRSSSFMPRWASRLAVDVVKIGVEPLVAISNADAEAEGIRAWYSGSAPAAYMLGPGDTSGAFGGPGSWQPKATPAKAFLHLWKHQNRRDPYDGNVWVWVISFHLRTAGATNPPRSASNWRSSPSASESRVARTSLSTTSSP